MNPFLLILPALLVAVAVVYGIIRALGHVWLEHRIKVALLEKLEANPELIPSFNELEKLVDSVTTQGETRSRQNYTLTGVFLGLMGLGCIIWGYSLTMGRLAVGLYFGGLICVCLGFVIALVGMLIQSASRPSVSSSKRK